MKYFLLFLLIFMIQIVDATEVKVGQEEIVEYFWDGIPLRTVDQPLQSPFFLRIIENKIVNGKTVYVLAYTLLEPEIDIDLSKALVSKTGQPVKELPPLVVSAKTLLSKDYNGALKDYSLKDVDSFKGYTARMVAATLLWFIAGVIAIYLIKPKKEEVVQEVKEKSPTVAELLAPLVNKAASNSLTTAEKSRLMTILMRYWQIKLDLKGMAADECIRSLREHEQAGVLLKALDGWLFNPKGINNAELKNVLEPYSGVLASDLSLEDLA